MSTGMNFTTFDDSEDTHAVPNEMHLSNAWRPVVKSLSDLAGLLTEEQAAEMFELRVKLEQVVFGCEKNGTLTCSLCDLGAKPIKPGERCTLCGRVK